MPKTGQMTGHDQSDLKPVWGIVISIYKNIGIGKLDAHTLFTHFWHCDTDQINVLISTELDWLDWNCFNQEHLELWSRPWFKFLNYFSMVPFLKLTDRSGPWPLEALANTEYREWCAEVDKNVSVDLQVAHLAFADWVTKCVLHQSASHFRDYISTNI